MNQGLDQNRRKLSSVIAAFALSLDEVPGWVAWRREKFKRTLYFDDPFNDIQTDVQAEFHFAEKISKQHEIIMSYLLLSDAVSSLDDVEFYFRRFPFRDMPISHSKHITNICEMYFSKFYEIKNRIKNLLNLVKKQSGYESVDAGSVLKQFDREFDQELRSRNSIHHHQRFDDIATDRVFLMDTFVAAQGEAHWSRARENEYRRVSQSWAKRVRARSKAVSAYHEAIAGLILQVLNLPEPIETEVPEQANAT